MNTQGNQKTLNAQDIYQDITAPALLAKLTTKQRHILTRIHQAQMLLEDDTLTAAQLKQQLMQRLAPQQLIIGEYGIAFKMQQQPWYIIGESGVGQAEDGEYLFTLGEDVPQLLQLAMDAPIYAGVHCFDFTDNTGHELSIWNQLLHCHGITTDFESKAEAMEAAQEYLADHLDDQQLAQAAQHNLPVLYTIILDALNICDWQSLCGYIWNEADFDLTACDAFKVITAKVNAQRMRH